MALVLFIFFCFFLYILVYFPHIYPNNMCNVSWLWHMISFIVWENNPPMSLHKWSLFVINLCSSRTRMLFPLFKCTFVSYLRYVNIVFRLFSTPSHLSTLPNFLHLFTTSQFCILFFFLFNNSPSIVCTAHVHMCVGPLCGAWLTYHGPYPQRKQTFLTPKQPSVNSPLVMDGWECIWAPLSLHCRILIGLILCSSDLDSHSWHKFRNAAILSFTEIPFSFDRPWHWALTIFVPHFWNGPESWRGIMEGMIQTFLYNRGFH